MDCSKISIFYTILKKLLVIVTFIFTIVIGTQILLFQNYVATDKSFNTMNGTDALVVFSGEAIRIKNGFDLASMDSNLKLIVSPAGEKELFQYKIKYHQDTFAQIIIENKARTTFENALYCSAIIKENRLQAVSLITSNYHMPRSYLLMRIILLGSGVKIYPIKVLSLRYNTIDRRLKIYYNEIIKFWGSLGEYLFFRVTGHVPLKALRDYEVIKWLKSALLFKI